MSGQRLQRLRCRLPGGFPVWSERYDRKLDDIFEVQEEIARAVAAKLRVSLTGSNSERLIRSGSNNVQSWELYLKGRYFWNKRTEQNVRLSIEQFEQALVRNPKYAPAYAGLADAYVTLGLHGTIRPAYLVVLARNSAGRALELKPQFPDALSSRACIRGIFEWDWAAAEREFEFAIQLNLRFAQARQSSGGKR